MTDQGVIGQPLSPAEDDDLLRGRAQFVADLRRPELEGALHATFVRSPIAAGTVDAIDVDPARSAPGVVAVVTGNDLHQAAAEGDLALDNIAPYGLAHGPDLAPPLLATQTIGFAGQALAMVVADTPARAVDAAEAVGLEVTPADPVLDLDRALTSTVIEPTRLSAEHHPELFAADGQVVIELTQWSPRQLPAPIESFAVAAAWVDDGLAVWAATQTPHAYRLNLGKLFGFDLEADPARVRVRAPAVGGGFGGKVTRTPEEYLIPVVARWLDQPVRWHATRADYFATATQGRGERLVMALAGDRAGRFSGLRAKLIKDGGAYPLVGVALPAGYTAKVANGCYDIAHVEFSSVGVRTNRPPTSAYRGAGRSPYIGALERLVDRFAVEVGLDPAEVRRRNLIRPDQMPYQTPTGAVYDEADYPGDLERALRAVGYDDLRREQAARRTAGDRLALGIGLACYNHMTTGGGGEEARVTIEGDGTALVVTGTTSQGQGHSATWAQIASDVLTIPIERIRVVEGDTGLIATGVGAVGSRSLQTAGMAVHRATDQVLARARTQAAELVEAALDDVVVASGGRGFHVVGTPARMVDWVEVAAAAERAPAEAELELSCGDFYDVEGRNTFPSGAHAADVEDDTETGGVVVKRLVGVDDAGTIVNPAVVEGQLHGGMASAIGQVLGEVVVHDELGNQLTNSFIDYLLPTADQLPNFELVVSETPSSFNTLGFKGVGESGTVGATGALHNAVIDALAHLGVRHLDLPCTPERVWDAIRTASPS